MSNLRALSSPWRLAELAESYSEWEQQDRSLAPAGTFLLVRELSGSAEHGTLGVAFSEELERAQAIPATVLVFALAPKALDAADDATRELVLGRGPEADLRLDHPMVSSAQVAFRGQLSSGTLQMTDVGSRHGTTLNGVSLAKGCPVPLSTGDVIELSHSLRAIVMSQHALHACLEKCKVQIGSRNTAAGTPATNPQRSGALVGKVAIITGGGRGLGRAYALRFAKEGCKVVVNDVGAEPKGTGRDARVSAAVVEEITQNGGIALASVHDVTRADEVEGLLDTALRQFGGVDVLVCSAGAMHAGSSLLTSNDEVWQRLLSVNLMGAFRCVQVIAKHMIATGRPGRIITTSSLVALQGAAGLVEYAASKAAVIAMSKTAALELAPHDITVNVLTPMAWTRLTQAIPAIATIPNVEQLLSPEYVADVAVFLASELATGISGCVVDVGGPHLSFHSAAQGPPMTAQGARWTVEELHRRWATLSAQPA